jgi:hypothetical protein
MRLPACKLIHVSRFFAALCFFTPISSPAAEFSRSASRDGSPDTILVVGQLSMGDEKQFINAALNSKNAIVIFQSPGGNLLAGIEIGKAIRLKGFSTFVPDGVRCASACALAWLGGRSRYMSETANVGFHAVYVKAEGQAAVSSAGNALVGAYLSQLGLPTSAIVYITDAPPDGMQWLNFVDARRYGIDVQPFNLAARPTPRSNSSPPSDSSSLQVSSVKRELFEFVGAASLSNELSLSYLERKYPDEVNYYGKVLSKESVLNDKKTFFKKWPTRNYSIRLSSVTIACETAEKCKTDAILDWEASGSILNSKGAAFVSLIWILQGNNWKISSENSRILERR